MLINEKTGISIALLIALLSGVYFVSGIYFQSKYNTEEIKKMRATYDAMLLDDRDHGLRIESRLSTIEAKLMKIEEWCKRLIENFEHQKKLQRQD